MTPRFKLWRKLRDRRALEVSPPLPTSARERAFELNDPDTSDFDPNFYTKYYADLAGLSAQEALRHYESTGQAEGRFSNAATLIHYLQDERAPMPKDFSARGYLRLNPDLIPHLINPWDAAIHYLMSGRAERRQYIDDVYTAESLHAKTKHVYDLLDVVVDATRIATVNLLLPSLDFRSLSAGSLGALQLALFIKRCGLHVRLVLIDQASFDEADVRLKLRGYPGLENLIDDLELAHSADRQVPLRVSPTDNCVATTWFSAYLARKILQTIGGGRFLYLIQDYESAFYPCGSLSALAEATYSMEHYGLFSSRSLQDFFVSHSIGSYGDKSVGHMYFNNACSAALAPKDEFIWSRRGKSRRLAFYSRPIIERNMFEIGALALQEAWNTGVFRSGQWELVGVGLDSAVVELEPGVYVRQIERMNLREYQTVIGTFDVGLTLMASPHPGLLPFDLAGSGAVVVTNSFGAKDQAYFDALADGIIACPPDVPALVAALQRAVTDAVDLDSRYARATNMKFPRRWEDSFGTEHENFVRSVFQGVAPSPGE